MVVKRFLQGKMDRTSGRGFKKLFITVHETDNTARGATADAHARLQASGNPRKASWGWTVDEREAVQSYTDDTGCWATGSKNNLASIDVEVCVNGDRAKAWENAAELVADLQREHPQCAIVQHNYHSGKNCPREMRASGRWESWLESIKNVGKGTEDSMNVEDRKWINSRLDDLAKGVEQALARHDAGLIRRLTLAAGLENGFVKFSDDGAYAAVEYDGSATPIRSETWAGFRKTERGSKATVKLVPAGRYPTNKPESAV